MTPISKQKALDILSNAYAIHDPKTDETWHPVLEDDDMIRFVDSPEERDSILLDLEDFAIDKDGNLSYLQYINTKTGKEIRSTFTVLTNLNLLTQI
jgi:hypothetical protein